MEQRIKEFLKEREAWGLVRCLNPVLPQGKLKISLHGKEYLNFSSNDYLGLASHPRLLKAAKDELEIICGTSASRLMTGSTHLHHALERETASFKKKPSCLVFNSGYHANVGVISALFGKGDCIFSDRLNHASIIDGILLSGAKLFRFRHNDAGHLEELLERERAKYKKGLIVTETVFSMDGDIAPIERIAELKRNYDCIFMVDEAHATGIFGKDGSGLVEAKGISNDVDIIMGTFSKALGTFGAYVASSSSICAFLVNSCRTFIYSTSLPPSIIAASLEALKLVAEEPYRRDMLLAKGQYFRDRLRDEGFRVYGDSHIVPIVIGDVRETVRLSESLKEKGYWIVPVRPPTVPNGEARLRISLSFDHSDEALDSFIKDIVNCRGNS